MFTLTAITLERWHTITHALQRNRRLGLRQACVVMAAGWIFSCVSAALPTVGVSSYSKVRAPPASRVIQGLQLTWTQTRWDQGWSLGLELNADL